MAQGREQLEGLPGSAANGIKMASVQGDDQPSPEPFGQDDD